MNPENKFLPLNREVEGSFFQFMVLHGMGNKHGAVVVGVNGSSRSVCSCT